MRILLTVLAAASTFAFPLPARQQQPVNLTPAVVPGAVQFDLPSQATGRTYRIYALKPMSPAPPSGYPVVFLTDGDATFGPAASRALVAEFGHELRPSLMVAITYATSDRTAPMSLRVADLTPTPGPPNEMKGAGPGSDATAAGNADRFYKFITEELRPALAAVAPIDPADQTLYGHSLGGLFTLHILFTHPGAFRTYVASSPSIWWDSKAVLKEEPAFSAAVKSGKNTPRVLILAAGYEQTIPKGPLPAGMTKEDVAKRIPEARMVDNARELSERLHALKGAPGYEVSFHLFEGESHTTVIPASISRALDFAVGIPQY